jgi:Xaa-Pro aminopeptidase
MAELGAEVLLVSHLPNIFYLTNVAASAGLVLVTPRILYLIIDFRYSATVAALVERAGGPSAMEVHVAEGSLDETAANLIRGNGLAEVAVEGAHLTVDQFRWWESALAPFVPKAIGRVVERVRLRKDAFEVALFREAGALISSVARRVLAEAIRPGRTELEIAADVDWHVKRAGFSRPAFETIVASGPNAALPHARPGDRCLEPGDLVVVDFGGVLGGYCVDVTRTVAVGAVDERGRVWHAAVCAAQQSAMSTLRPGVRTHDVDGAARRSLEAQGLGAAFGHATGHGLGLDVHEDPRLGREVAGRPVTMLESGMVCTIEPGVYFPGHGGVRIEDDVLITDEGYERLTDIPYDLALS